MHLCWKCVPYEYFLLFRLSLLISFQVVVIFWIHIKGPCKVRNETETKRNETKQIETKRNRSKRNETNRNETKQIETKRNKSKRNKTKRNKSKRNETNDMASHCGQKFSNIRKSFSNIKN